MYLLSILSPFLGCALAGFAGRWLGARGSGVITVLGLFVSCFCSVFILYEVAIQGCSVYLSLGPWFAASNRTVNWGFLWDSLSACMMLTVTLVSLCVHIYSRGYMQADPHLPRFMSYLSLFTGFMLVLVCSDNMIQMLIGWEGIGVCSYLLIGFWFHRLSATKSAVKAMLVNRVSDTFLMISIVLMWWYLGSTDVTTMLATTQHASFLDWICGTMRIGAMGKSAQIGFHVWLADAMEGPTPVSALIHAATLVTAGVFVIARTSALWECSASMRTTRTIVGCRTSFLAATCGFFQNDMKRVIAYSTCSQLGYMMVALGLSYYSLAIYHLMTHACFKALLFLSAGVVIHAVHDVQDVRLHGGIQQQLPWAWGTMLLGSLSLAGWPFLSGFYSKDAILEYSWSSMQPEGFFAYYSLVMVARFTSYYSFRLLFCSFVSKNSSFKKELPHPGVPFVFWFPLFILSLGSIWAGYLMVEMLVGLGTDFWHNSIFISPASGEWVSSHFIPSSITLLPFFSTLLGMLLAAAYSWPLPLWSLPVFKTIYVFFSARWQFDYVYNQQLIPRVLSWGATTMKVIDKGVLEILGPTGMSALLWQHYVPLFRKWQTGTVHDYALMYKVCVLIGLGILVFPLLSVSFDISLLLTNFSTELPSLARGWAILLLLLWTLPSSC